MDYDKNTNIRYHIFKEFSKHREFEERKNLNKINEFSIPVFSGICSSFITVALKGVMGNCGTWLYILAPVVLYFSIYKLTNFIIKWWNDNITSKYGKHTIKESKNNIDRDKEERAAKFNYEVVNLVQVSYSLVIDKKSDALLDKLSVIEIIFYLNNVLRKINESLFKYSMRIDESKVPSNKISVVMEMIYFILCELKNNNEFSEDIGLLINSYAQMSKILTDMYGVNLKKI